MWTNQISTCIVMVMSGYHGDHTAVPPTLSVRYIYDNGKYCVQLLCMCHTDKSLVRLSVIKVSVMRQELVHALEEGRVGLRQLPPHTSLHHHGNSLPSTLE